MTAERIGLDDVNTIPVWDLETGNGAVTLPAHSWHPIDLAAAEADPPSPPTINQIVYPGRVHVWSGEPETLKSLVAMAVALAELQAGHHVVYVDLENGPRETTSRLRALGATDNDLQRLLYITPTQALEADLLTDTLHLLEQHTPTVAFVDSYTGSLAIHRCDPNSAIDVERHHQEVVNHLRAHDAAVVLLDHLPKNRDNRGRFSIGSERKIGVCDIHLGFELIVPLSRGHKGVVKLVTHKDRPGYLHRPKAAQATFHSTSDGHLAWQLEQGEDDPDAAIAEFRPTILMERVSRYLSIQTAGVPISHIEDTVQGNRDYLRKAVEVLVKEGYAAERTGPRKSRVIEHVEDYRELSDQTKTPDDLSHDLAQTYKPSSPNLAQPPRPTKALQNTTSPNLSQPLPTDPESTSPKIPSPPTGGTDFAGRGQAGTKTNENNPSGGWLE